MCFRVLCETADVANPGDMVPATTQVEQRMVNGLLALVAAERGGETVDRSLLSNLLRCFISLGTYLTAFQVAMRARQYSLCRFCLISPLIWSGYFTFSGHAPPKRSETLPRS